MRVCEFPGCDRKIDLLPQDHIFCTKHEIDFNVYARYIEAWFPRDHFENKDYIFFFIHQEDCNASELERHLHGFVGRGQIVNALDKKRFKGKRSDTRREWRIGTMAQAEITMLARYFETIAKAANRIGADRHTMLAFATDGQERFGEVRDGISGYNMIRIQDSGVLKEIFDQALKEAAEKRLRNIHSAFYDKSESSTIDFGEKIGVSDVNVRHWIKYGYLRVRRSNGRNAIPSDAQREFISNASKGKLPVSTKVVRRCRELAKSNSELQKEATG